MKAPAPTGKAKAFTVLELFVILALIAVFAASVVPVPNGSRKSPRLTCMSKLRQFGVAMSIFAEDHGGQFPMQTSITNGGSMVFVSTGSPAPHFQTLSNYLQGDWGVLLCPTDKFKQRATNYAAISDRNISYFLSTDATYGRPANILAGDRNLEIAGQPVKPGLFALTTNAAVRWTSQLHGQGQAAIGGNLLFGDGHVEASGRSLPAVIQRQNLATNHLAFP
jgi:prepilin-type processing-associated H-X9-DG protein